MPVPNSTPALFHELSLVPSRHVQWMFWIANGLALLAIFVAALPVWLQLLAAGALCIWSGWYWRHDLARDAGQRVCGLRWTAGRFQLREVADATWRDAKLLPGSRLWPGWMMLQFRLEGRSRQLLLPADCADADQLRRLRVLLRLQRQGAVSPDAGDNGRV